MRCIKSNKVVDIFIHDNHNNDYSYAITRLCINCTLKICKNYNNYTIRDIKMVNNIREVDLSPISIGRRIKVYDDRYISCDDFELNRYVY